MSVGCEGGDITYKIKVDTSQSEIDILKLQMLARRSLTIIERLLDKMGAAKDTKDAVRNLERMITLVNTLRLTIIALETASGPMGLAFAALGIITFSLTAADMTMELDSH